MHFPLYLGCLMSCFSRNIFRIRVPKKNFSYFIGSPSESKPVKEMKLHRVVVSCLLLIDIHLHKSLKHVHKLFKRKAVVTVLKTCFLGQLL